MKRKLSLMPTSFTRVAVIATTSLLIVSAGKLRAQVSYMTQGSTYSQDFDNLLTPVPANNTTVNGTVLPTGWGFIEAGANGNTSLRIDNGSSGTGDTYLYGATSSNERAFGSFATGSLNSWLGVQLMNNSGSTISGFTITYDGEQWKDGRSSTSIPNKLTFSYSFDAVSLTNGTYFNDTALDFTALTNSTSGADLTLDGNLAANRMAGITDTITGSWTNGASLWLRWTDVNDPGNDDGLAIDNFSFTTPAAVPEPQTLALLGLGLTAMWRFRRHRQ